MELFQLGLTIFFSLLLQSLPSLLLGILLSSTLLVWDNSLKIAAKFPSHRLLGAIVGSSLGLILPVGQYGIIPLTRRLVLQGVSFGVAWSFLVAGPCFNLVTIWLSWQVWSNQPQLIFIRLFCGWLMGVLIGFLWSHANTKNSLVTSPLITQIPLPEPEEIEPLEDLEDLSYQYPIKERFFYKNFPLFLENTISEIRELVSILVLTCTITALVILFLPPESQIISPLQDPLFQTVGMMLLSGVFSLDSWMSTDVVASLSSNLLEGSRFAFLFFGSVNLISLGLLFNVFRPKLVIYLVVIVSLLTLLFSLIINFNSY